MVNTPYRCPICWSKVYPDGCAFYCKNCTQRTGTSVWINPKQLFNIAWASVGAEKLNWSRSSK